MCFMLRNRLPVQREETLDFDSHARNAFGRTPAISEKKIIEFCLSTSV